MLSWSWMFGIYPEGKLVALLDWLGGSSQRCASNIHSWSTWNWTNQCCMPPILVLHSSWIQYDGPSSWVYSYGGCPGCLRQVFSWCSTPSTIEMTFSTQQTMTTEMTRLTKGPSTIEKTQLMQWKTMETIKKPTTCCLWTDSIFLSDSSTLTYPSSFLQQTSFVGWIGYSSWFQQLMIVWNETLWCGMPCFICIKCQWVVQMDPLETSINSYVWYLSPYVISSHGSSEHIKIPSNVSSESESSNGSLGNKY